MRDPKRIDKVLAKVKAVWEKVPDWRLTQLIENCGGMFYTEDEKLVEYLENMLDKVKNKQYNIYIKLRKKLKN